MIAILLNQVMKERKTEKKKELKDRTIEDKGMFTGKRISGRPEWCGGKYSCDHEICRCNQSRYRVQLKQVQCNSEEHCDPENWM